MQQHVSGKNEVFGNNMDMHFELKKEYFPI